MTKKIPQWFLRVVVIVALIPAAYFAWEWMQGEDPSPTGYSAAVNATRIGTSAADFKIPADLMGNRKEFLFSSVKGSPILFHFWATWCGPCVSELPELIELAKKIRLQGFTVVTVASDDSWETVNRFFTRHPKLAGLRDQAVIILDPRGKVSNLYNVTRFPETLLINSDFVIDNKLVGPQPWTSKAMHPYLDRLKKEGSS